MKSEDKVPSTISELLDYYDRLEEKQRRLDSRWAQKIGIFYVIERRLFRCSEFKDLVEPGPDGIRQYGIFESLWRSFRQFKTYEVGLYHYPRGRIVFNDSLSKLFAYVDICLLKPGNRSILNQILIDFNLDNSQVSILRSLDYNCATCHDDWGFQEVEVMQGSELFARGKAQGVME